MFKLGADPEIFLKDASNAFISAIGKIGGSKQFPRPLPIGDGFAVQEDNVALEYNIPPAEDARQFSNNIEMAMQFLSNEVQQYGLKFANECAVSFPEKELMHPDALVFGCDPDFNAWKDGKINPRPKAADKSLRTCGGHVHIGYNFQNDLELIEFIKHADLFLGVPSVLMDKDDRRRELYGKRGAFRFKFYGGEYRSMSNFWVFTDDHRHWVWDSMQLAMDAWQNKKIDINSEDKSILQAINKNNKKVAQSLVDKYNLLVV